MNENNIPISLDTRSVYRITIQGKLDPTWITDMCDMRVQHETPKGQSLVTTLTGELIDQAALLGILNVVYNLGYPLLSLSYLGRADQPVQRNR